MSVKYKVILNGKSKDHSKSQWNFFCSSFHFFVFYYLPFFHFLFALFLEGFSEVIFFAFNLFSVVIVPRRPTPSKERAWRLLRLGCRRSRTWACYWRKGLRIGQSVIVSFRKGNCWKFRRACLCLVLCVVCWGSDFCFWSLVCIKWRPVVMATCAFTVELKVANRAIVIVAFCAFECGSLLALDAQATLVLITSKG